MHRWLGLAMDPAEHIKHKQERAQLNMADMENKKKTTTTRRPSSTTTTSTTTTTTTPVPTTAEPEEESFDAREEWPECADMIGLIQACL